VDGSSPSAPVARSEAPPESSLPPGSATTSIGSPSNGRLEGGLPLPLSGGGFRFNERRDPSARHATVEVIGAIMRAAARVRERFTGSELIVNDLSLPQGGRIAHHGSHRAGRDADILFYLRGDDGGFTPSVGAPIDPDGLGFDFKDLSVPEDDVRVHFDAERTWAFVAALLEDREADVQRIFVVEHLREALLRAAERANAPAALRERFGDVACQPSYPHDDHLHVRWFCSFEDLASGCEDLPPLYPWREASLRTAGIEPRLAQRTRSVDPAPVTTLEQAEQAVARQKPHANVVAFLTRRKRWEKQPHPGRPYCP
jgi:penicillin-insensitive murein endopeptidase